MFIFGATAGLHCIGMCGPIVLALQAPVVGERRWMGNLVYNLGRITTYVVVGTVLYLVASRAAETLPIAGAKKGLTLFVGVFLILFGVWLLTPFRLPEIGFPKRFPGFASIRRAAAEGGGLIPIYLLGVMLGFIPCGMTYALYLRTLDATNAAIAAGMCLAFGVGTLPWLLLTGVFSHYLVGTLRKWGEILSGLVMIGIGIERIHHACTAVGSMPCH